MYMIRYYISLQGFSSQILHQAAYSGQILSRLALCYANHICRYCFHWVIDCMLTIFHCLQHEDCHALYKECFSGEMSMKFYLLTGDQGSQLWLLGNLKCLSTRQVSICNKNCHILRVRIQGDFGLVIQNFRASFTCYNSYLVTLGTLHSQNSAQGGPICTK